MLMSIIINRHFVILLASCVTQCTSLPTLQLLQPQLLPSFPDLYHRLSPNKYNQ